METVQKALRGEDVSLTLDGKVVAELFSSAGAVVRLKAFVYESEEQERMLTVAPTSENSVIVRKKVLGLTSK